MNKLKKFLYAFLLLELLFSYAPAFAQSASDLCSKDPKSYACSGVEAQITRYLCTPKPPSADQTKNYGSGSGNTVSGTNNAAAFNSNNRVLYDCINQLYKFAIIVAVVIGVFFIVIGGYIYMSAEGNQESVTKAKDILFTTIVSLIILLGGYVLLKQLNPDLIQFHSIQPPSVTLSNIKDIPAPNNVLVSLNADGSAPTSIKGGVGPTAPDQLTAAGCTFQTPKQHDEAQNMTQALFDKIKALCGDVSSSGVGKPAISSVIGAGDHAKESYHYKGCAIDFADGAHDGFFNIVTKTGRPVGVAIYNAAIQEGFSQDRIDPGKDDRAQSFHIHVDLGSSCPSQ